MNTTPDIIEQAIRWHLASQGDAMDWDAFTLWLEEDPAHAAAYDEVSLTNLALAEHRDSLTASVSSSPQAANDEVPETASSFGWKRWAGAAIAASLLAIVVMPALQGDPATTYHTDGQSMTIALEDGSSVVLAPASELVIEGDAQEHMALAGGAYFDIVHDPSRQLTIDAGPLSVTDIGTAFDIQAVEDNVRVAVGQGTVNVTSPQLASKVELQAGRQLQFDGASGRSIASQIDTAVVGDWRKGQLSYSATPLTLVSADLGRYAGVEVEVPGDVSDRLFSGTLSIDDGNSAVRDLSQLMDLELERVGSGYRLHAAAD